MFDGPVEEAAKFYVSVFPNSEIKSAIPMSVTIVANGTGVSWQIVPDALGRYLGDPNREKTNRALQVMLKMKKIIVADLDKAYAG